MEITECFLASCNNFDYPLRNEFVFCIFTWLTVLEQYYSLYSVYYYDTVDYIYPTLYDYYSLCRLIQLEKLNIGRNPLNTVPEVVSSLASLKELNMWNCDLSNLPDRFVEHSLLLFQIFNNSHFDRMVASIANQYAILYC